MSLIKHLGLLSVLSLISFNSFAKFNGEISFTDEEKKIHLDNITSFTSEADTCLKERLNRHQEFFRKYGLSAYYGDNSSFARLSENERIQFLQSRDLDPKLINEITNSSCVGMALACLERSFKITNQSEFYKRIYKFISLNGLDGTALQFGLSKLGWKTLYWNPQVSKNKKWDFQERLFTPLNRKHMRGDHEENYRQVINKKMYFMNNVDDATTLVNFGETSPSYLKNIPFFIGTAHMGYHVFPGSYGIVVEGHASRAITDENSIESAPFNPLDSNGAPSGRYRSGIMSIPPGF